MGSSQENNFIKFRELNIGDIFTTNDKDDIYIKTKPVYLDTGEFSKALQLSTLEDIIFFENSEIILTKRKKHIDWNEISAIGVNNG